MVNQLDHFLEHLSHINFAPGSIKTYRYALSFFKNKPFTIENIQEFHSKIQNYRPYTKLGYLLKLKRYLTKYHPELVPVLVLPKLPKTLPFDIPTEIDIQDILKRPDTTTFIGIRDRAILELLYGSGLRRSEVKKLTIEDIDFATNIIRINQSKNNKDRLVPFSEQAKKWLHLYITQVRNLTSPLTTTVFVSSRSGKPMVPESIEHIIKKYAPYSPHKYRHAYATHLLRGGMKEVSLQRLLGHAQIETTQIYTKVTIQDLTKSLNQHHPRLKWTL